MTKSLLKKMMVTFVVLTSLVSGTAFAQGVIFSRTDRVQGFDTDIWRVWVPAGSSRVVVDGGSHTDLDLEVYDAATGRLLAVDGDGSSYCIGDFYKPTAGWIEVHIENLGRFGNSYQVYVR